MLMHSKSHTLSSLPLTIRYSGPADVPEAEWTTNAAWADLIHRVEVELEKQILRFKLTISERPQLEWSWQEELSRGGMECTILIYIHTGVTGVSVQKRKYLHWIALEQTPNLNNEVAFAASAHNLLVRSGAEDTTRQALRNKSASIRASPQAARKKRFTKLDMIYQVLINLKISNLGPAQGERKEECQEGELVDSDTTKPSGSISQPVARNRLTYV
ncbi:unnamed protein product [Sphagnum balticum]